MKQRLVGAIVLGCLAIIFIPIVLDGEGVTPAAMTTSIPSGPSSPPRPQIDPVRPVVLSDTEELDLIDEVDLSDETDPIDNIDAPLSTDVDDAVSAAGEAAEIVEVGRGERPSLNVQGLPKSWSVRLASFGEMANAEALLRRILDKGYKGYKRPVESSQGQLAAVYVGPVLTQAEADQLQLELKEEFDLNGIVVQFTIQALAE